MFKSILIFFLTIQFISSQTKEKCYVLALEGGGDKGAYQAGAIKGLVESIKNSSEAQWDVISGVSIGALNAVVISIFDKGQESSATDLLLNIWRSIKGNGDLYQNWPGGFIEGLFEQSGLFDTSPGKKLLSSIIKTSTLKRKFIASATDLVYGNYTVFDGDDLSQEDIIPAVLSSGAYPVIFNNINFNNSTYMDGGVMENLNIPSGINKCLSMGYEEKDIVVDAVLLNSKKMSEMSGTNIHPIEVLIRVFEIWGYQNSMNVLNETLQDFPLVDYRYVIIPSQSLPGGSIPLNFSPDQIEEMISLGIKDAQNVVGMGSSVNLKLIMQKYNSQKQKRKENKYKKNNLRLINN